MNRWTVTAGIRTATPLGPVVLGQLADALGDDQAVVTYCIPGLCLQFDVETEDRTGACRLGLDRLATVVFPLLPGASLTDLQLTLQPVPGRRPQAA